MSFLRTSQPDTISERPCRELVPPIWTPASHCSPVALDRLTANPEWVLVEDGFTLVREHEAESLLATSNGYIGTRGSVAEGTQLSAPATFLSGVFEVVNPGDIPGLVVLPDWTHLQAIIEGHPLTLTEGDILSHRRVLDMQRGVLWREWEHRDVSGRVTRMVSMRLASLADRHLLLQSVVFTPVNYSGAVELQTELQLPPTTVQGRIDQNWRTRASANRANLLPIALRPKGTDITVAMVAATHLRSDDGDVGCRDIVFSDQKISERICFDAEVGRDYRLDRVVSVYSSRDGARPTEHAIDKTNKVVSVGLTHAVSEHERVWSHRWQSSNVEVDGDEKLERDLRFAIYHLIGAANPDDDHVSIGARALTGHSYKGHVFWDTEIFMLPFYTFTHPESARALLMYRYHTLPAAREKARNAGYRGAMYAWESTDTGEETTPPFVIALDGTVVVVPNGKMEVHITADVAYAVWQYWQATADTEFFVRAGVEILIESARFWASRGRIESDGRYHIRHVIGPDEYHEDVDDNAYTNLMAQWNLRRGVDAVRLMRGRWSERWHEFAPQVGVTEEEVQCWEELARVMFLPIDPNTGIFEQFEGFYTKDEIDLKQFEPRTAAMDVILGHERIQQTNVVKQADVVMATCLLWSELPWCVKEANFRYYEPRTGHGSSLSPSMHALVAARLGMMDEAIAYLKQSAEIDLGNNMGNAAGGIHAAAIGGLWQAVVFGFAGVQMTAEGLSFAPHLAQHWRCISIPLQYRGTSLTLNVCQDQLSVCVHAHNTSMTLELGGHTIWTRMEGEYCSNREAGGWSPWRAPDSA